MKKQSCLTSPFGECLMEMCSICGEPLPNDNDLLAVNPEDCSLVHIECINQNIEVSL